MRKLFYMPLEPYKERYTVQLSAPKKGWLERRWVENSVNYERIDGISLNKEITVGSVLDACGRGHWALSQIMALLRKLNQGEITGEDCIYFDDFWHPGISALPYAFDLIGQHPKMFAMLHAQSIDQFDFTYPMRQWMRHFEKGVAQVLSGIFVTSTCLKDLCLYHGVGTEENVFLCGLPYNSDEVKTHFPIEFPVRKKQVVYSSRWDKEKCPGFFLSVVEDVVKKDPTIRFVVTTSARKLRSNNSSLLLLLQEYLKRFPDNLELKEDLSKEEYYKTLLESKMQINTADQDFVSWTLLEATTCGCRPVYPYFLSFPEVLRNRNDLMYVKGDVQDASANILRNIDKAQEQDYSWVYKPFDQSWKRMLSVMEGKKSMPIFE